MAAVTTAPGLPPSRLQLNSESLSKIPNTRTPDEFPSPQRSPSSSPHPDLNNEVANLSNKLISAINHQTNLDDTLAATRQELEALQYRVQQLEAENKELVDLVASGELVRKSEVEEQASKLVAKLAEERKRRTTVEKDKKGIEQELESLTTALFEEANQMVAAARKDRETAERRNEQLRAQLNDTELLLASQQEQLTELKAVMQQMSSEREDPEMGTNDSTAPSTPAVAQHGESIRVLDPLHLSPAISTIDDIAPAPPTSFAYLLSPVLRTDLQFYEDFRALTQISKRSTPASRVTSASYTSVNGLGLTNIANRDLSTQPNHIPSNSSTTSLSTPNMAHQTPVNTNSSATILSNVTSPLMPLKETRFYKRALTEDIEPTLRLDAAPGLSWLARRTVITSMCDGTLVVEPMPASTKMHIFSCALCGENRKGDSFTRTHRFRTSESEHAQRYPLCNYCLNRIRASCDYLGFLRMIKDGHWRTDGVEAEKLAWEESVRLRERMFWARIGGGVVPALISRDSPRASVEDTKPRTPFSAPPVLRGPLSAFQVSSTKANDDPFLSGPRRSSNARKDISRPDVDADCEDDLEIAKQAVILDDCTPSQEIDTDLPSKQRHESLQESLKPMARSRAASYERERASPSNGTLLKRASAHLPKNSASEFANNQGLSITIPGAFE